MKKNQQDIIERLTLEQIKRELQAAIWMRDDANEQIASLKMALEKKRQPPNKMGKDK